MCLQGRVPSRQRKEPVPRHGGTGTGLGGTVGIRSMRKRKQEIGLKRSSRARPQSRDHRLALEKHLPSDSLVR